MSHHLNNANNYLATFGREGEAPKAPATFQLPQGTYHQEYQKLVNRSRKIWHEIKKITKR